MATPRTLAALGLGTLAVLVSGYLLVGWAAISAVAGRADGRPAVYEPWRLLAYAVNPSIPNSSIDVFAAFGSVVLAAILLWRMPVGQADFPVVRPALALMLATVAASGSDGPDW